MSLKLKCPKLSRGSVAFVAIMSGLPWLAQVARAQESSPRASQASSAAAAAPAGSSTRAPKHNVAADAAQQLGEDAAAVPPPITFRPWAEGVREEDQLAARALFQEGNRLLRESLFAQAINKYEAALARWDHPAIHYNHALALSTLDQPFKTRDELIEATKHGAGPLGEDQFLQAKRYQVLVEKQLAYIKIECGSPGAVVTLNGKALFTAPGRYEGFVLPGEQLVSATKEAYISDERVMTLIPGRPATVRLGVYTEAELTRYERKWPEYGPWIVTGAGAVVTGVGAWFFLKARDEQTEFDNQVASMCSSSSPTGFGTGSDGDGLGIEGCSASSPDYTSLVEQRDQAKLDNVIGISMLSAGGAALITGAVLLYVNRAQPYRLEPKELEPSKPGLQFSAAASPSAVVFTGRGTF